MCLCVCMCEYICIISPSDSHKHLGMILDTKLNFMCHLSEKISKANKGIGIIKRLYDTPPRATLVNIYKTFVRPHLDYGITRAIHGSSHEKFNLKLGFESLCDIRWNRKLCFYYKIRHDCPLYLTEYIPNFEHIYSLHSNHAPNVPFIRTERFQSLSSTLSWNKLDPTFKILIPFKFLNEDYLNLFVISQH